LFANHNIYAYAHRENNIFLQIISIFGCYFLSFIIALFSSLLDYSIDMYKSESKVSKFVYCFLTLILMAYFFGSIRLLIPEEKGTYNIASSIGMSNELYEKGEEPDLDLDTYIEYINSTMKRAKDAKCEIMTYAEEAFAIMKDDKNEMIKRVSELASIYQIFVLLPLDIQYNETYYTNEAILISDEGKILYNYQKQHLIPYIEKDYYETMDNVKVINTKLGKITVAICYDINFPYFLNNLSREHFDILLVPSWDWEGIAEFHSNEIKYRAIEGGFNLVKNTANGNVIGTDIKGRVLSYYIGKNCDDYFVISTINKKGIITLYSYIGIFFNYLYLLVLICILVSGKITNCLCPKNKRDDTFSRLEEVPVDQYNSYEESN